MKSIKRFLSELIANRMAQVMVLAHFTYVLGVYALLARQSGLSYHASEEPFLFKLLTLLDYPAIFIVGTAFAPAYSKGLLEHPLWLNGYYLAMVVATTIQWLLVGYVASKLWRRRSPLLFSEN
jgi:hypothetical protein